MSFTQVLCFTGRFGFGWRDVYLQVLPRQSTCTLPGNLKRGVNLDFEAVPESVRYLKTGIHGFGYICARKSGEVNTLTTRADMLPVSESTRARNSGSDIRAVRLARERFVAAAKQKPTYTEVRSRYSQVLRSKNEFHPRIFSGFPSTAQRACLVAGSLYQLYDSNRFVHVSILGESRFLWSALSAVAKSAGLVCSARHKKRRPVWGVAKITIRCASHRSALPGSEQAGST